MSTIMEGFRYRINDSPYPVAKEGKILDDFPVIPIGMLKIWREQNEEDDFNFLVKKSDAKASCSNCLTYVDDCK